ncbi:MAG: lipopolysaccharide heptosyltransferase II [Planctomycetota bacterium]
MPQPPETPLRLLVVAPSWVGDVVMATPALRRLRDQLPGATIAVLPKPGVAAVLDGLDSFDQLITSHPGGMMGHKHTASKLRQHRFDTALLLTNSFSTALTARMAGIPRRIGYDRDGRGLLLTHRLRAPKRGGDWAIVPAVDYYWHAASAVLGVPCGEVAGDLQPANERGDHRLPAGAHLELGVSDADRAKADELLRAAGIEDDRFVILNPGGNNPAKRWPAERFAELAHRLQRDHGMRVLINGSPAEAELAAEIAAMADGDAGQSLGPVSLPAIGGTLGGLKALVGRAALLVTNDTGPRHFAAALGTPVVTLFGPTDHRWTTIPTRPTGPEAVLVADPDLPAGESANDHPERCRVDRITLERVVRAAEEVLGAASGTGNAGA